MAPSRDVVRRAALGPAITGGSVPALGALSSVSAAAYFARRVLTPDRERPDDTEVLAVEDHTVTLGVTADTVVPGRYGLWLDGAEGHQGDVDPGVGVLLLLGAGEQLERHEEQQQATGALQCR